MAVAVRQSRNRQPGKAGRRTRRPRLYAGEDAVRDVDEHPITDRAVAGPGALEPIAAHRHRSSRVSARASTPAKQSAVSACSSGEGDTPVGFRANSMAVGTPAADSPPASCPAMVGITGQAAGAAIVVARSRSNTTAAETDSAVTRSAV